MTAHLSSAFKKTTWLVFVSLCLKPVRGEGIKEGGGDCITGAKLVQVKLSQLKPNEISNQDTLERLF